MKTRSSLLMVLALLVALVCNAGAVQAQAGASGAVVGWGYNNQSQLNIPYGLTDVAAIAAGVSHNLVLRSDGTVYAWGLNWDGETTIPAGLSDVTAISAGWYHSLALKSDGAVVPWGDSRFGLNDVPSGLANVTAIAAGYLFNLALKGDGTVVAWGDPSITRRSSRTAWITSSPSHPARTTAWRSRATARSSPGG